MTSDRVYQLVRLAAVAVRPRLSVDFEDGDVALLAKAAEAEFQQRPQSLYNVVLIAAARVVANMRTKISQADVAEIAKQAETVASNPSG